MKKELYDFLSSYKYSVEDTLEELEWLPKGHADLSLEELAKVFTNYCKASLESMVEYDFHLDFSSEMLID